MQTTHPSYAWRNILAALLLGAELVCFAAPVVSFMSSERLREAAGRPSWEGEAGGLMVAVLVPLALYTLVFFASAMQVALKRGSRPMSGWAIFFGLLPLIGLTLLIVLSTYPR